MHDVAEIRIIAEGVLNDFAKSFGKKALIQLRDGIVDVFFGCGDSALHVALVHSVGKIWLWQR
jgi:hypothetical protein